MKVHRVNLQNARGLGLIELMVALAISALLLLGLVQLFSGTRVAYQTTEGLARVQENGRFAMDFLQRDIRMAGHMGCVADAAHYLETDAALRLGQPAVPPDVHSHFITLANRNAGNTTAAPYAARMDMAIQGYEAVNTGPTNVLTLLANPVASSNVNAWDPPLPADLANRVVEGSDVVVVRFMSTDSAPVTNVSNFAVPPTITVPIAYRDYVDTTTGSGLFGLTDCLKTSVFQNSTAADAFGVFQVQTVAPNVSGFTGDEGYVANSATLHRAEIYAYYVGIGAGGIPALFRLRYNRGLAPLGEELVEGVENMQLLYGHDTQTAPLPDGAVDAYGTAAAIFALPRPEQVDWHRVGIVRVGLLMRSTEAAGIGAQPAAGYPLLGLVITPPNDARLRSTYVNSVALRNRLFGN
ncbi:MAG: PilW family protein [Lysobacterales bacterium]